MKEQRGITANTFKRRASLPPGELTASYHRVGTRAGLHPEDNPYITYGNKPLGRTYITTRTGFPPGYNDEDNSYDEPRTRSTVVVRQRPDTQVDTVRVRETDDRADSQPHRRPHLLVYVGVSLLFLALFIIAWTYLPQLWQHRLDDMTYGYPRTYQTDANVRHGGISHFIVLNRHGTIEVVELPQDPGKNTPRLYLIASFANEGADLIPATVSFYDLNGDGKVDMIVTVYNGANPTIYQLYNDGTQFRPHL